MEQKYHEQYKLPRVRHISSVADNAITYIKNRRDGKERSLKTGWDKLDAITTGGLESGVIMTVAGISGSGKSAFGTMLSTNIVLNNPDIELVVLFFSLEMLSERELGRRISAKLKRSTRQIYSSDSPLSDKDFEYACNTALGMKKLPIYYVDAQCTVDSIVGTIHQFRDNVAKDKWLVIILDHTLLVRGKSDNNKQQIISELEEAFIQEKKIGKTTIIQLAQLNRDIEKPERINNLLLHYPTRADLSSSDAMYFASDYVLVIHRPETLNIFQYGPKAIPSKDLVFLHVLKNRDGELGLLFFVNDLKYNNLIEPNLSLAETVKQIEDNSLGINQLKLFPESNK